MSGWPGDADGEWGFGLGGSGVSEGERTTDMTPESSEGLTAEHAAELASALSGAARDLSNLRAALVLAIETIEWSHSFVLDDAEDEARWRNTAVPVLAAIRAALPGGWVSKSESQQRAEAVA